MTGADVWRPWRPFLSAIFPSFEETFSIGQSYRAVITSFFGAARAPDGVASNINLLVNTIVVFSFSAIGVAELAPFGQPAGVIWIPLNPGDIVGIQTTGSAMLEGGACVSGWQFP